MSTINKRYVQKKNGANTYISYLYNFHLLYFAKVKNICYIFSIERTVQRKY